MSAYRQLTCGERYQIECLLNEGISLRGIAQRLGRHVSTLSREVGRSGAKYSASEAQRRSDLRRKHARKADKQCAERLATVRAALEEGLSPEQIAGRLRYEGSQWQVSHEWIYQLIARDRHANGQLHRCLRRKGKRYRKRRDATGRCGAITDRVPICERPEEVEERNRLGDWEGDTMHGSRGSLVTLVDRKSGFTRALIVKHRTAKAVAAAINRLLRDDPCETLTLDNGSEFADHKKVAERLKVSVYFAEPYASWQRGTNENTNGLLRQYLPKRCDMLVIKPAQLKWILNQINLRPRKRLGWKCPAEVFYGMSVALVS